MPNTLIRLPSERQGVMPLGCMPSGRIPGCRVQRTGCRAHVHVHVHAACCRVQGAGCRVQGGGQAVYLPRPTRLSELWLYLLLTCSAETHWALSALSSLRRTLSPIARLRATATAAPAATAAPSARTAPTAVAAGIAAAVLARASAFASTSLRSLARLEGIHKASASHASVLYGNTC